MSSSLANARRKFDASVRGIHLPTDIDPQDPEEPGFKTVEDRQVSRKARQMLLFLQISVARRTFTHMVCI
jgi:hypothetical protein